MVKSSQPEDSAAEAQATTAAMRERRAATTSGTLGPDTNLPAEKIEEEAGESMWVSQFLCLPALVR